MTKDLFKQFLKYLGPSVAAMWVFSLYTIVDGIFVSKGIGELALASVNIAMPFINFIFAISVLFSTGASTIIAIYLGKKDLEKANEAFSLNLFTITALAIIITTTSILGLDYLAKILGATPDTIGYVKDYLFIISLFNIFFIVSNYQPLESQLFDNKAKLEFLYAGVLSVGVSIPCSLLQ